MVLDMMNQMLNQMQTITKSQSGERSTANKNRSDDGKDFDSLIRKKQEAVRESSGNETPNKKSAPHNSGDASEKAPEETKSESNVSSEKPVLTDEQYAMAAAMLMQPQLVPMSDEVAAAPTVKAAAVQSEALFAVDGSDVPVMQFVPEAPKDTQQQTAVKQGETLIPQSDELPKTKSAHMLQEDFAPELRQIVRKAADELTKPEQEQTAQKAEKSEFTVQNAESVQIGLPVFENVDVIPVKVAEPSAPLPLEAEDGVEQMGARIESLLTNENGDQTVELTLTPEELGTVRVSITHATDGTLHIQMSATTARAANLLERGVTSLQNILTTDSRPTVEIQVRGGENAQQQFLNPNDQQQNQQQQQQQQQRRQDQQQGNQTDDFMQQLRLGLVENAAAR